MVQNIYSMMDRAYEKGVIPYCQEHNIGFVAFSPIASGYLSGKVDPNQTFTGDDVRPHVVPIPGSKNKGRILENLGAWEVELSDGEFQELEDALGRIAIHGQRSDLGNRTEFIDA